jgi:hypothetical protein
MQLFRRALPFRCALLFSAQSEFRPHLNHALTAAGSAIKHPSQLLLYFEQDSFKMPHSGIIAPRSGSPPGTDICDYVHHSGDWDSGFFDVCAAGVFTMCQAHFCPCITYAQNERSLQMRENPDLQPSRWSYVHHIPWYCCMLSCGTHCFMHQRYRSRIRMLYQIKNASLGDTGDFLLSW